MKKFFLFVFSLSVFFLEGFDIVIPVHEKDRDSLDFVLTKIENNIIGIDRIFIISKEPYTDRAIWIDEKDYPFTIDDVGDEIGGRGGVGKDVRRGWYYQQLLKFYVHRVCEDLSEHFLIFDSDTIPVHEITFITEEGKPILDCIMGQFSKRTYYPYADRFLPAECTVSRTENPVVHHMMFSQSILEDFFANTESRYERPFWKAFLNAVADPKGGKSCHYYAGASEYFTYFYYSLHYHRDEVEIRNIKLYDRAKNLDRTFPAGVDFASFHKYNR